MTNNKEMLKDNELEKVSGGRLRDNWIEIFDEQVEEYRKYGGSYLVFKEMVLAGDLDDYIVFGDNITYVDKAKVRAYLESIKWE